MNALISVSSEISNGSIILNFDCDNYSNNSKSILDALCFFMDEKKSQDIAFVQFPQKFENVTKNDIYGASLQVISEVELAGMDGFGGPCYIGTGCFHRRDVLCGKKYKKEYKIDWKAQNASKIDGMVQESEERAKALASSTYELNSQWGKEISSPWFLPFPYIIMAKHTYSLVEFLYSGGTVLGWWNEQRIWLYKRTSSYLFAMIDMILKIFKFSDIKFVITTKVADEDVSRRYNKEIMEFGVPSPMFTVLTSLALINLFTLEVMITRLLTLDAYDRQGVFQRFVLQILLSGVLVMINILIFEALFVRKDKGKMPISVTVKATLVALLACALFYR